MTKYYTKSNNEDIRSSVAVVSAGGGVDRFSFSKNN